MQRPPQPGPAIILSSQGVKDQGHIKADQFRLQRIWNCFATIHMSLVLEPHKRPDPEHPIQSILSLVRLLPLSTKTPTSEVVVSTSCTSISMPNNEDCGWYRYPWKRTIKEDTRSGCPLPTSNSEPSTQHKLKRLPSLYTRFYTWRLQRYSDTRHRTMLRGRLSCATARRTNIYTNHARVNSSLSVAEARRIHTPRFDPGPR